MLSSDWFATPPCLGWELEETMLLSIFSMAVGVTFIRSKSSRILWEIEIKLGDEMVFVAKKCCLAITCTFV